MNKTKQIHLPLSTEEQAQRLSIYLAQKKEQLFQGCLYALLSNPAIVKDYASMHGIVDTADGIAGIALEKLYPNIKTEE